MLAMDSKVLIRYEYHQLYLIGLAVCRLFHVILFLIEYGTGKGDRWV